MTLRSRAALLADEGLERSAIKCLDGASLRGGKRHQAAQIPAVTVEGVIGKPALDTQMLQVGFDHH